MEKKQTTVVPGVIRISGIPYGFFEEEIRKYYSQFGKVTNVKVIRHKVSSKPTGLAFVQFQYEDVAKIACDSSNNYLLVDSILKCKLLKQEDMKHNLFRATKFGPDMRKVNKHNDAGDDAVRAFLKKQKQYVKELRTDLEPLGLQLDIKVPKLRPSVLGETDV